MTDSNYLVSITSCVHVRQKTVNVSIDMLTRHEGWRFTVWTSKLDGTPGHMREEPWLYNLQTIFYLPSCTVYLEERFA